MFPSRADHIEQLLIFFSKIRSELAICPQFEDSRGSENSSEKCPLMRQKPTCSLASCERVEFASECCGIPWRVSRVLALEAFQERFDGFVSFIHQHFGEHVAAVLIECLAGLLQMLDQHGNSGRLIGTFLQPRL